MEAKCYRPMYRAASVHIKEPQVIEISKAFWYHVPHNCIVVLAHKTLEIIMLLNHIKKSNAVMHTS